jgi:hypothetical protein
LRKPEDHFSRVMLRPGPADETALRPAVLEKGSTYAQQGEPAGRKARARKM